MLKRYRRQDALGWRSCLVLLSALCASFIVSGFLLWIQGKPPIAGLKLLAAGAFGSWWAVEDCLAKAIPIFLCSLGVAIAFRLQIWNIGAEGQFVLGAIGATWVALTWPQLPWTLLLPIMAASAFTCGALWGFIPAVLKLRMRANEIIVTLMLNYIAILLLDFLVYGKWKDPGSFGFPMTPVFAPGAVVGRIGDTGLNWGLVLCVIAGSAVWAFLHMTRLGYELRVSGESTKVARYAGMPYHRLVGLVMILSGGMAALAGFLEASATLNRLQPSIVVGYGYTAIVVAWISRLNPLSIGIASFLLAALRVGVENLQLDMQVPAAFGHIMEGLILMCVLAGGFFHEFRIGLRRPAR
ncbi:MAG: ABC transporter permease [Desulfobacterales bacterium]